MRVLLALLALGFIAAPAGRQRDVAGPPAAAGTAMVSGTVVTDETPPVPARRAVLTLTNIAGGSRTTTADGVGRFAFESLPAGRFTLSASKGGYVQSTYGAMRPGGAGVTLALVDAQRTTGLVMTLVRGGVITGTVRDRRGSPVRDALVYATHPGVRVDYGRGLAEGDAGGSSSVTDDRGVYRIFGLRPAEYFVWAEGPFWIEESATRMTTAEDLQRARQLIQSARPGAPAPLPSGTASTARPAPAVRFVDTYYPGSSSPADASLVRVGPGEERAGIDLQFVLVPSARLAGAVIDAAGRPPRNVRVWIRPATTNGYRQQFNTAIAPDGTFNSAHVLPGEYIIGAEAAANVPDGSASSSAVRTYWARLPVTVNGIDQTNLELRLRPGVKVSGRVAFEGEPGSAAGPAGLSIKLVEAGEDVLYTIPSASVGPDGSFVVDGVAAGRYRVIATLRVGPLTPPPGWFLKSIAGAGPDLADVPLEVKPDTDVSGLTITLTSRTTELAGVLQDATGHPAAAYTVVAFTTDRGYWLPKSRRIQTTRPADDGTFSVNGLPAGEYYLAAVTAIGDGQSLDPGLLSKLAALSVKVTIVDGQRTVQNLQIAK